MIKWNKYIHLIEFRFFSLENVNTSSSFRLDPNRWIRKNKRRLSIQWIEKNFYEKSLTVTLI